MSKKEKKEKSIKDVENEIMNDGYTDELPGMPEKSELEKQVDKAIQAYEDYQVIKSHFLYLKFQIGEEEKKLLPLMKEKGKLIMNLITNSNEKISINKKKDKKRENIK